MHHSGLPMSPRYIARVALFLALPVVGFVIARARRARRARDSDRRAEVAAVQIHGRITQAASLDREPAPVHARREEHRRHERPFREERTAVAGPGALSGGRMDQQIPAAGARVRAADREGIATAGRTLWAAPSDRAAPIFRDAVTGFPPMAVPGIDLSGAPRTRVALESRDPPQRRDRDPMAPPSTGARGLFLAVPGAQSRPGDLRPGYVVVFVRLPGRERERPACRRWKSAAGAAQYPRPRRRAPRSWQGQRFSVSVPGNR